jgi:hypothetical protein
MPYLSEIAAFMEQILEANGHTEPISQAIISPYQNSCLLKNNKGLSHESRHQLIIIREQYMHLK